MKLGKIKKEIKKYGNMTYAADNDGFVWIGVRGLGEYRMNGIKDITPENILRMIGFDEKEAETISIYDDEDLTEDDRKRRFMDISELDKPASLLCKIDTGDTALVLITENEIDGCVLIPDTGYKILDDDESIEMYIRGRRAVFKNGMLLRAVIEPVYLWGDGLKSYKAQISKLNRMVQKIRDESEDQEN
ncbi:MAG: hypothetical protein LKJ25_04180 [Clostridia bacterium]|nr:hypothetical protein [Clostridia bacterium]